jgi:hypothetical protein
LVIAALVAIALERVVPFGRQALYPFTLLATWVHEMGHGIAALLVGGRFASLEVFADASGLAHTQESLGFAWATVSAGGLIAPPLVGALVLATARGPRRARVVLLLLALALAASIALWVRSLAGLIAMPLVALAIGAVAWFGSPDERQLFAQFLGVLLGLDTVTRIDYLFTGSARIGGVDRPSDVANIATAIGGTYWMWGAILAALSLALLAGGLWMAWRLRRA